MLKKLKLQGLIILSVIIFGFVFNLLFTKSIIDISNNTDSKVPLSETGVLKSSYPWFRFILPSQEFIETDTGTSVLVKRNNTLYVIDTKKAFIESILSPYALITILLSIIVISSFARNQKEQHRQKQTLDNINSEINDLLLRFNIETKALNYASTAAQISQSISLINEQIGQIQQQSDHHVYQDKLTQLIDRHAYIEHLEKQLKLAEQNKLRCGLLFIDLDGFKQVNDTYGHGAGDELLKLVAKRLKNTFRESDTVGRLGGDEFLICLPHINEQSDAITLADKAIAQVAKYYQIKDCEGCTKTVQISASLGIAYYPESGKSVEQLIQVADQNMYCAKKQGKNRYKC